MFAILYTAIHFPSHVISHGLVLICANVLFVIADVCKKSDARNVVTLRCKNHDYCQYLFRFSGCKCFDAWYRCPREVTPFVSPTINNHI